jgi:hypothetical protein
VSALNLAFAVALVLVVLVLASRLRSLRAAGAEAVLAGHGAHHQPGPGVPVDRRRFRLMSAEAFARNFAIAMAVASSWW